MRWPNGWQDGLVIWALALAAATVAFGFLLWGLG